MGNIFIGGTSPNAGDLGAQDVGLDTSLGRLYHGESNTLQHRFRAQHLGGNAAIMEAFNDNGGWRWMADADGNSELWQIDNRSGDNSKKYMECFKDGAVVLKHNNVNRFETTSNGAGVFTGANESVQLTARNDIRGFNVRTHGNGTVYLVTTDGAGADGHNAVTITHAGSTALHFDNNQRFETSLDGARVYKQDGDNTRFKITNSEGGIEMWTNDGQAHLAHIDANGVFMRDFCWSSATGSTFLYDGRAGFNALETQAAGGKLYGTWEGTINPPSDPRLKTNEKRLENSLEKVLKLEGYSYDKAQRIGEDPFIKEYGFMAPNVKEVAPELVREDDSEDKVQSVNYNGIIPMLSEAIKEQQEMINTLKDEIKALKGE
ncbi:long tail fiber distal subunit [Vibrio phage RYC]|nr:long tail fiber distal subunit [Vibrio phage RYC]